MKDPFGGFTEEALAAYQKALAEQEGTDFAEGDSYDFTTCIRPDGSAYGTGGKCRKGTEGEAKVTATPGMAARAKAAKEKLKAEKAANGGKRPDRIQEERRLEQNRKQREMDRKVKANQEKQENMLRQPAKKPEGDLQRSLKLRQAVGMAGPEQRALAQRMVDAANRKQERATAKKPESQDATTRALEMVKANARSRGLTEIKAGGSKPTAPAGTTKKPAVQGYDWRKQSGTFNKAAND